MFKFLLKLTVFIFLAMAISKNLHVQFTELVKSVDPLLEMYLV